MVGFGQERSIGGPTRTRIPDFERAVLKSGTYCALARRHALHLAAARTQRLEQLPIARVAHLNALARRHRVPLALQLRHAAHRTAAPDGQQARVEGLRLVAPPDVDAARPRLPRRKDGAVVGLLRRELEECARLAQQHGHLAQHEAPEDCEYYICGPPMMNTAVVKMLEDLGVTHDHIMLDDFGG